MIAEPTLANASVAARSSWRGAVVILLLLGATIGPALDAIHTHTGTIVYPQIWFFQMAWWVPLLFASAALGLGVSPLLWDRALGRSKTAPDGRKVALSFVLFVAAYFASGLVKSTWPIQSAVLLGFFAVAWWLCDRSWLGVVLAIGAGAAGCGVEITLVHFGYFRHLQPDFAGIPGWLPFLYFTAQVALANLARRLAYA